MVLKFCKKCSTEKPLSDFSKKKSSKDGLDSNCSACCRARAKAYREANPEKAKAAVIKCVKERRDVYNRKKREYAKIHSQAAVRRAREWNIKNPEAIRVCRKNWKVHNKHKINSYTAKRRAKLINATPKWLKKEQLQEIEGFYESARERYLETGVRFHVDHIVPLNGKTVCGLHVPWNLQILPEKENLSKSNKVPRISL